MTEGMQVFWKPVDNWSALSFGQYSCRRCGSALVQTLRWEQAGADHWRVFLWCPDCFEEDILGLPTDHLHLLQNQLDEATGRLEEFAAALDREAFRDTCKNFCKALQADLISPSDF